MREEVEREREREKARDRGEREGEFVSVTVSKREGDSVRMCERERRREREGEKEKEIGERERKGGRERVRKRMRESDFRIMRAYTERSGWESPSSAASGRAQAGVAPGRGAQRAPPLCRSWAYAVGPYRIRPDTLLPGAVLSAESHPTQSSVLSTQSS